MGLPDGPTNRGERAMKMVIHNGKRYRPEDAERLGITKPKKAPAKKTATKKTAARNKARTVEDEGTGGPS